MKWYCYETVNNINGKYYRGKSSAEDPDQDMSYLGSGPALRRAIKKYGRENFTKKVLAVFDTEQAAYDYEAQIVTLKEVQDPMCYNMQEGGLGGAKGAIYLYRGEEATRISPELFDEYAAEGWIKGIPEQLCKKRSEAAKGRVHIGVPHTEEWKIRHSLQLKGKPNLKNRGRKLSDDVKKRMSESHRGKKKGPVSEETKAKIRATLQRRCMEHPTIRVTNGTMEKAVEEKDLQTYLDMGWVIGRKPVKDTSNYGKHNVGKHHSEETKAKMRKARLGGTAYTKGKTPINNGDISKYVYPEELESYLAEGWTRGRLFRQSKSIYKQ